MEEHLVEAVLSEVAALAEVGRVVVDLVAARQLRQSVAIDHHEAGDQFQHREVALAAVLQERDR